jgi:hypothetical protein
MDQPPDESLYGRVNRYLTFATQSAQLLQKEYPECSIGEMNEFYIKWDAMVNAPHPVLSFSSTYGVQMRPNDEFCVLCHIEDCDVDFNGYTDKLSVVMRRIMENALTHGRSLDEAVRDTFYTYNNTISPTIRGVQSSLSSPNGGAIVDRPLFTLNALINHYCKHALGDGRILLDFMLEDAEVHCTMETYDGIFNGTKTHADLQKVKTARSTSKKSTGASALIQQRRN